MVVVAVSSESGFLEDDSREVRGRVASEVRFRSVCRSSCNIAYLAPLAAAPEVRTRPLPPVVALVPDVQDAESMSLRSPTNTVARMPRGRYILAESVRPRLVSVPPVNVFSRLYVFGIVVEA